MKKITLFIIILSVVLTAFFIPGCNNDAKQYEIAVELLESGKFKEAIEAFEKLGDFGDSQKLIAEARKGIEYVSAEDLFAKGNYEEAAALFELLGAYRDSEEKAKEARSRIKKETQPIEEEPPEMITDDYISLTEAGYISVAITGNRIDVTDVSVLNHSDKIITVLIPIGAYFKADNDSVQDMAVRTPAVITIFPNVEAVLEVDTCCMNIHKNIPDSGNSFTAGFLPDSQSKLKDTLTFLDLENESFAVTQAAVWLITDNASDYDLLNTLVQDGGESIISRSNLDKAKEITGY
ncbi:MAG: hypothetical protein FWG44_07145 [Oscillospiraceae bacterium]|nr:hypothetical protein [Oscillospiraceae bacterium]